MVVMMRPRLLLMARRTVVRYDPMQRASSGSRAERRCASIPAAAGAAAVEGAAAAAAYHCSCSTFYRRSRGFREVELPQQMLQRAGAGLAHRDGVAGWPGLRRRSTFPALGVMDPNMRV